MSYNLQVSALVILLGLSGCMVTPDRHNPKQQYLLYKACSINYYPNSIYRGQQDHRRYIGDGGDNMTPVDDSASDVSLC